MSAIYTRAITAQAVLRCDGHGCGAVWESPTYTVEGWDHAQRAAQPALALGWRVFAGGRGQHAYCPQHGPKVAMCLIYGVTA